MVWSTQTLAMVILLMVNVPVLSEQMQLVDPNVSTESNFFTNTFFVNIRCAVKLKQTWTVANKPSGTLATMIPIIKTKLVIGSVFKTTPMIKKVTPRKTATPETKKTNLRTKNTCDVEQEQPKHRTGGEC